jgi:enediyne biosynthesis protein CalE5
MIDQATYKDGQRALWDAGAAAWDDWHDEIEAWLAPVDARLFADAGVGPGKRVLDLATGVGDPAVSLADRVGEAGEVVGIDISSVMIETARRRAGERANVSFLLGDIETMELPGGFDAVVSRLGLMFVLDQVATLAAARASLRPGGSLALAVWGPADRHLITEGLDPLFASLDLPEPPADAPTPFCMSDAARLEATLRAAGFTDVAIEEVIAPVTFDSVETYVRFNLEALPPDLLRPVAERYGAVDAPEAWDQVAAAVRPRLQPDGSLALPSLALCARAVNPER